MNFLLEIGTEEIPHWMIRGALAQLSKLDLFGAKAEVDATPRRLVVRASGLPEKTPDQEQLVKGPPITAGEKAAEGFAKKQGVELSAMTKVGNYYELRKKVPGRAVRDILAESLPTAILSIQWPKTMYWGAKGSPRFIRPIRWVVALLGDEVIPFEVAGVKSGNLSRGHRVLANVEIAVTFANFVDALREKHVILSADERRAKIESEARALGATIDPDLLETLTYITEYPAAIKGDFDAAYLELPAEVLTMVMRHHQKYFAVETSPGKLAPHFVAVMNVPSDPEGLVKRGNERVLKARFNDARFFWEVDQKKKLADRVEDLSHVTFQAKLGNYLQKTSRVRDLVQMMGGDADAARAATLCKTDLTTEMVKEFTDLQGIVGALYAGAQGENNVVASAIYEHYKPLSMEDSIPSTRAGQILSVADKLDNLREFFGIGMEPTGSKDPFALRRAAQGIVKILVEGELECSLNRLQTMLGLAYGFLLDRVRYYFREIKAFRYDEVNAVLTPFRLTSFKDVDARLKALSQVRTTENFEPVAASAKRIRNILEQAKFSQSEQIDESLLEPGPELDLYKAVQRVSESAVVRTADDYTGALLAIASLRPRIDAFFDKVLVNATDPRIRNNRLTLLSELQSKLTNIADFSEIVTSGDQK